MDNKIKVPANKLSKLLRHANRVRQWLTSPEAIPYQDFLGEYLLEVEDKLGTEGDVKEIYRLQGEKKALKLIITIKVEVQKYLDGLRDGTMEKIN